MPAIGEGTTPSVVEFVSGRSKRTGILVNIPPLFGVMNGIRRLVQPAKIVPRFMQASEFKR
jgi:hypothetical protein